MIARSDGLPTDMIMAGAHVPKEAAEAERGAVLENKAQVVAGFTADEETTKNAAWTFLRLKTARMTGSIR